MAVAFKVCGIRRVEDAVSSARLGAEYLGFNFYRKSPRFIGLDGFRKILPDLPETPRVAVMVEPEVEDLAAYFEAGFDALQIHFSYELELGKVAAWSDAVGPEKLWLAPKIAPDQQFMPEWLPLAASFLWDGYRKDLYGGTGKVSNWSAFSELRQAHPDKTWILAGGLGPDNLVDAVDATGARVVDVNSGVEESPGLKDPRKIKQVKELLLESR